MRIFISHAFADEDLASKLKEILEENDQIEEAYMAQKSPDFEIEISDKIIREILNSDYLVAIITKRSKEKPSVHQELGFSQGVKVHKIPLIEKDAKIGVFLKGKDRFEFDKTTFEESCKQVLDYILKHGVKRKFSQEEGQFVQRSAHYRYVIEYNLIEFMDAVIVYLELNPDDRLFFDDKGRQKAHKVLEEFIESSSIIGKLKRMELRKFFKIFDDYDFLRRSFEDAKRFQYSDLYSDEQDVLIQLSERILEYSDSYLNLQKILRLTLETDDIDFDTNYEKLISENPRLVTLNDHMKNYWFELRTVVKACIKLDTEFVKLRKKFGDIAFKSTYGED